MESDQEQSAWRKVKYAKRFLNAFRGIYIVGKTTRHAVIYLLAILLVLVFGFLFRVSLAEWAMLVFAVGFVLVAEAFNTAIEIDIDLTSPEFHPFARDTKDVAAGAVLLAALTSAVIGGIIFLPKLFNLLS